MTRQTLHCKLWRWAGCVFAWASSAWALAASPAILLKVGVPAGLPGFEFRDQSQLIIIDPVKKVITECIAKKLGVTFSWVSFPNKRVVQMVQDQELDMIFPMGFTPEREATMLQSRPAWQNPDVFVSLRAVDMTDKAIRIAVRFGSPQHADYVAEGYSNVTGVYSYEELAKFLAREQVDVVVVPRSVYTLQLNLWPRGTQVSEGRPRGTGFYLNKDDPKALFKPLNQAIDRCKAVAGIG